MFGWYVTHDYIFADDEEFNQEGSHSISEPEFLEQVKKEGVDFYLYDDDGELYYHGKCLDTTGEYDEQTIYGLFVLGMGVTRLVVHFPDGTKMEIG